MSPSHPTPPLPPPYPVPPTQADPLESLDIASKHPIILARMRAMLEAAQATADPTHPTPPPTLTPLPSPSLSPTLSSLSTSPPSTRSSSPACGQCSMLPRPPPSTRTAEAPTRAPATESTGRTEASGGRLWTFERRGIFLLNAVPEVQMTKLYTHP